MDIVLEDIRSLVSCFDSYSSRHVKKAKNTVAHFMARFDTGDSGYKIFGHDVPVRILTLAEMDSA